MAYLMKGVKVQQSYMVINIGKSAEGLVNNKADKGFVSLASGLGLHLGAMESQRRCSIHGWHGHT